MEESRDKERGRESMVGNDKVEDILRENRRRLAVGQRVFDPVSGEGSVGARVMVEVAGLEPRRQWWPESMMREPLVREILSRGGVSSATRAEVERLRALHDFPYWAATRAHIKAKGGGEDILFRLNAPQRKLVGKLEEMRLAGKPIRLILLKARQWGGSTCVQLYMAWLQLVHAKGLNSLIIAHQGVGSEEIKDMFDRMMAGYPDLYLYDGEEPPKGKRKMEGVGRSRSMFRIPARNCKIKVGTAERPDSCRGGDYSLVHCSEVGIWKATLGKTPEQILRSACSGVLLRPMTMIVYESTANGTGNFFHREYEAARRGVSQFESLFVAWHEIEQYSMDLTEEGEKELASRLVAERGCEAARDERCQPGKYLWWLWERGATLQALAWYEAERSKYSDHGLMAAEYPSDDVEAFVHSGARVFDRYRVEALRAECREPICRGEIDVKGPAGGMARFVSDGDRATMLGDVEFRRLPSGEWKIWRFPGEGKGGMRMTGRYVAVVDVGGRGLKSDWSVIVVLDRAPMLHGEGPEVVAQWRGHTDFDLLAWRAAMAAQYYGEALLVIESNTLETRDRDRETDGDQSAFILNRLRDVYPNLYMRAGSEEDVRRGVPAKYGFHTNMATKPMIIGTLVKVIREGLYKERDEACLDEYLSYERRPNGSFGAIAGCHDDLLMTRAIGLHICFHEMDMPHPEPSRPGVERDRYQRRPRRNGYGVW